MQLIYYRQSLLTHLTLPIFYAALFMFPITATSAEFLNNEKIIGNRVLTLWSDNEECYSDNAYIISIESQGDTYKMAACSAYGCRIAVPGWSDKTHKINYRNDPNIVWITDVSFQIKIKGNYVQFYQCKM